MSTRLLLVVNIVATLGAAYALHGQAKQKEVLDIDRARATLESEMNFMYMAGCIYMQRLFVDQPQSEWEENSKLSRCATQLETYDAYVRHTKKELGRAQ
jgi:hypothetical protein